MNKFTLDKLEFNKIIKMLIKECSSSLGEKKAQALEPIFDYEQIVLWQEETSEGVLIRRLEPQIPLGGLVDTKSSIRKAEVGGLLEAEEFLRIEANLRATRKLKSFLTKKKQYSCPRMEWWAGQLTPLPNLEEDINNIISPEGEIRDDASFELARTRKRIATLLNRIKDKLDNMIKSDTYQKYLQDPIITIRGDRYVIPVKQEYRGQVPGIIHDQSASGATLFIEPMAVVEMNNDLRKALVEERDEVNRILQELSKNVGTYVVELRDNLEVLAQIDFIFAKARLSEKMSAVAPKIVEDQKIDIIKGRHPLISPQEVVPLTISLGKDFDALVITGPNTGGKTVTLKTVGLFVLMSQSGLHIPAELGSTIGLFNRVFADIGDEQSIEQSLSTFSSHMTNIVKILGQGDNKTLVLMDELGAGTDPSEGAALAIAIIDYLLDKDAKIIATTHYSELKTYAFNEARVQNASVEFDIKTLRPTYHLLIGVPGKSNAFEIASRLGLNTEVVQKARGLITQDEKNVADLIESLEANQLASEKNKLETELRLKVATAKLQAIEKEEEALEAKAEKALYNAQVEALEIVKKARRESEEIIKEIRTLAKEEILKAEQKALDLKKSLEEEENKFSSKVFKGPKITGKKPTKVKVGQEVFIPKLNQSGTVITEPNSNGELQIQAGILKITVNIDELQLAEHKVAPQKTGIGKLVSSKSEQIRPELDFRGTTVDEAIIIVDKYLDDAYLAGLAQVSLIHGKGTGVLRSHIRDMLKNHPHVRAFRTGGLNEGGTGVTIVEFKR